MSFRIRVRIRRTEGTMVRLLGLVQRRNYDLLGLTAELTPEGKAFEVVLDFKPLNGPENNPWYRSPEVLERMIAKLVDVEKVELEKTAEVAAKKGGDKA